MALLEGRVVIRYGYTQLKCRNLSTRLVFGQMQADDAGLCFRPPDVKVARRLHETRVAVIMDIPWMIVLQRCACIPWSVAQADRCSIHACMIHTCMSGTSDI